jgi:transposase
VRLDSQLHLIDAVEAEIKDLDGRIRGLFDADAGYRALLRIPGIGPVFAAILRAEIGEIGRFPSPRQLNSWAGLTPRHRESDTTVHRGAITKQGSRLVRWAAVEAIQRTRAGTPMRARYEQVVIRRGATAKHVAKVAAARELLDCVFYALRDGRVRRLGHTGAA